MSVVDTPKDLVGDQPTQAFGARTIDELVRLCALQDANHIAVVESHTDDTGPTEYTAKQIDHFAHQAALIYSQKYGIEPRKQSDEDQRIIAISGNGDFDYLITVLALEKLGHAILFLSPRLSNEGCAQLLRASKSSLFLIQRSHKLLDQKLDEASLGVSVGTMAARSEYDTPPTPGGNADSHLTHGLDLTREKQSLAWILHSSGSTGTPRLVRVTNKSALARFTANLDAFGLDTLSTVPLFHALGLSNLFRAFICHRTVHLYSKLPIATQELVQATGARGYRLFSAVPFTVKLLAESAAGIEFLRSFETVTTGGSPMPKDLGDELVRQGVRLTINYGSSETGTLLTSARPSGDDEWDWLRRPREDGHSIHFEKLGADIYELICTKEWPMISDSNQEDGSWRTKDLFAKHPTIPDAFKYVGRLDDVMVLENGEKVNPIAVEAEITSSPLVDACIIFGTGRSAAGVAVVPSSSTLSLTEDEVRSTLWPVINESQRTLPTYARFTPDMLLILPAGSEIPRTDKSTVIRPKFLHLYLEQINDIYDRQEVGQETRQFSEQELVEFLSTQLEKLVGAPIETGLDTSLDFSAMGLNSLQAIQLRSLILKHVDLGGSTLGLNVVFDFPTVELLAKEVTRISSGAEATDTNVEDEQEAEEMIARYGGFARTPRGARQGQHVILTGATGSLGAHILAKLALSTGAVTVYCLVRASSNVHAQSRVEQSLRERRLRDKFPERLPENIVCLAADMSDPTLGLGQWLFSKLARKVDSVYHCGWTVNFNQRLRTFEKDCIAGVHHLINLCTASNHASPARFIFFSSVGAILNTQEAIFPERLAGSISETNPTGYSRSKYVGEKICAKAAAEVGLPVAILRIGQIVGDTTHGIWNTSEASPLMIRSAKTIGALPALSESVRWLPVDEVAQIALEIGSSSGLVTEQAPVFNLVNPNALRWTEDLLPLFAKGGLTFETVAPSDWLLKLEQSDPDANTNPTRKLLDYFREQCKPEPCSLRVWKLNLEYKLSNGQKACSLRVWELNLGSVFLATVNGGRETYTSPKIRIHCTEKQTRATTWDRGIVHQLHR
ncbi:related to NRPS-like enzyme [Cephalotrichum gorgonifer]|uniref:Related to NRPS-like enzyme n=1 Tax=Cephalotrichum gorgonifer TaxID=2041049 RepID=A0AAE8N670_9PEZI|nr:related to NRPS-like enzyme [Cephalotrichum gorgonifer]